MKVYADKHRTEREFNVGDFVYLKLQPYRQQSVERSVSHKLSPRFYGPFEVQERIDSVAYKLKLSPRVKIHPMFHVSLLKKKLGTNNTCYPHLPLVVDPSNSRWFPAKILARGLFKKGNEPVTKWLIQWMGAAEEDATWELASDILLRYPDFNIETYHATQGGVLKRRVELMGSPSIKRNGLVQF